MFPRNSKHDKTPLKVVVLLSLCLSFFGCEKKEEKASSLQTLQGSKETLSKTEIYQSLTGEPETEQTYWNELYDTKRYVFGKKPAELISQNLDLFPMGKVLDIAMGEGRNAVYLSKKGFVVEGVDLSEVAIRKAKMLAKENKTEIITTQADLGTYQIKPESYDLIINIDYLQRSLFSQIKRGLKRKGVVVFEANTIEHLKNPGGSNFRPEWLLKKNELKEAFGDFEILFYLESNNGQQAKAKLIARKP